MQRARQPEDGEGTEGENAEDENAEEVEGAEEGEGTKGAERSNHLNEGEVDQDECFFQGEDEENEDDGLVIGASSESIREDDAADGDNAADGEEACGGQHDSDESFVSCDDLRANVNPARPLMEALFGAGGDHDTRGGALDQWVRRLRDEDGSLSPHHQEVTHQGVWAEEPLPESEQGPGVAGAENAEADYMQTYVGGYIVVHHCRQRQEYFYPGGLGFPVDPARLRNERMSVCTFSTGLFSRTGTAMTFEDNWRITGPHASPGAGGWWTGMTVFVLQGKALPWETPPKRDEGGAEGEDGDEETMDDDPEISESQSTVETRATRASRSRSRSARRSAGGSDGVGRMEELAEEYMKVLGEIEEPTPTAWARVLTAGDSLLNSAGSVKAAAEALWRVREQRGFNNLKGVKEKTVEEVLHPDMVSYLRSVEQYGMSARHEGVRSRVVSGLHPNAKKNLDQVYKQIWKDVRKRRVLVVRKGNPLLVDTVSSPFEAVDKMLPDRTIAPDKRVVHDQRQVNLGSDKTWHPPALQPTHQQIARRVLWCRTRFPGLPVLIAKKDIAGAFRLLWVAPEDVPLFAGDLPWKENFMAKDEQENEGGEESERSKGEEMTVLYLVSSFGFLGSPGEWTVWGRATEEYHRAHRPRHARRDGAAGFDCKILVDDAILVEPELGMRPWVSANCYEAGVKLMLGNEAVNEEKDALEGQFKEEQTIWGLTMNARTNQALLPERRILKGAHLLSEPAFDAENQSLCLRQLQQFRGIATGWAVVVKGLKNELKAADVFLTNGDGALPVKPRDRGYRNEEKAKKDAWNDLWDLFEVCRWLCARSETWGRSFCSTLEELLDPRERLALPHGPQQAVFVSADATKKVIGAIDWTCGKAARMSQENMGPWLKSVVEDEADEEGIRIHVTEMLAIVAFASRRCEEWAGKVIIYAGDNKVVRQWIDRRQSGSRAGRLLLRALAMCEMRYGFVVIAGWWRTFHNVDSDFITRCSEEEYLAYLEKKGWEDVSVAGAIEEAVQDSRRFGQCFLSWADPEDRRVSMQLKDQRLRRTIDRPISPPWSKMKILEWTSGERMVRDFEIVASACGANKEEAEWVVCAATVGCDLEGKTLRKFLRWAEEACADVGVVEGPLMAGWKKLVEEGEERGWYVHMIEFVTTEFGEALARRRRAAVLTKVVIEAEIVEAGVVRAVVAPPLGAILDKKDVNELVWRFPMKLEVTAGAPRNPLLPHIAAHFWEEPEVRRTAHGMTGPGKWPLRSKEGADYEELVLYDRCGPPGAIRALTYEEVWVCQGRSKEEWCAALRRTRRSEKELFEEGCKATGIHTAQTLLTLAGLVLGVTQEEKSEETRAGAVRDGPQDESLARLLLWLRKWKRGEFGQEGQGRRAGGVCLEQVWFWGETLWCDALDDLHAEQWECCDWAKAGGRKKRESAEERLGKASIKDDAVAQPFDGDVQGRVEDWLEANMTGDKAESTARAYASMWQKWVAWAQRQQWLTPYLNPSDSKLMNENKMPGFLGYLGWLGASAASMKQALFALKDAHKRAGYGDPTTEAFRVWLLVNALDRRAARKPRRLGVTPGMLRWIGTQLSVGEGTRG